MQILLARYLPVIQRTILLGLCLNLGLQLPMVASKNIPLDDLPPSTGGQSAGSRGCGMTHQTPLQLLSPHIDGTPLETNTPTFTWYQGEQNPSDVEFRIYEYKGASKTPELVLELLNPSIELADGVATFHWPTQQNPLKNQGRYIWQVELVCNPNRPSGNIFADAPLIIGTLSHLSSNQ